MDRIYRHLGDRHQMARCFFDSQEWLGAGGPSKISQAARLFYNPEGARRFESAIDEHKPDVALFHNVYPIGSPALYRVALRRNLPVLQYLHNFRPFSVGGTLYASGELLPEALSGNYWREIKLGAWRDSQLQTTVFAMMLKFLHASGWLRSVKAWVAISEFMRDRLIEAGRPADDLFALRHSWDALSPSAAVVDAGYYLLLGRLVEVKGIRVALDAWDALVAKFGDKAPPLHIAGEGPMEPLIRERARANPAIRFRGMLAGEEKSRVLRECRALLAPSIWWEPLGLVVYEAYDFAKPVLAAKSGGLTETVQHGVTGLLHEPESSEELVNDVMTLQSMDRASRERMGAKGREWLLVNAGVEQWKARFEEILRGVAARAGRPNDI